MRCIFLTLVMFFARSALTAAYYFNFTLAIRVVCGHVNFGILSVIGFEVALAALKVFLVEMYSIFVICHSLEVVTLELTDLASYNF